MSISQAQIEWLEDLNCRYMKHNISAYYIHRKYTGGKVDFTFYFKETEGRKLILIGDDKEYNVNIPNKNRENCINELKHKFLQFLEEHKNIRILFFHPSSYHILLSTYKEDGEKIDHMDDSMFLALNYTIRFPNLDYEGYYILSDSYTGFGYRDFDTDKFKEKYNMDVSIFPYNK